MTEPVSLLEPYWNSIDQVTIVGTPMGTKGTSMEPSIFDKIQGSPREIEKQAAKVEIQIDGGIRRNTVRRLTRPEPTGSCRGRSCLAKTRRR